MHPFIFFLVPLGNIAQQPFLEFRFYLLPLRTFLPAHLGSAFRLAPHFNTVDPPLGRIDKAFLSQQTLMELLIEHIENKDKITTEDGSDIQSWNGIEYNEDGDVTRIDWFCVGLHGEIDLQWLPSTITYFRISENSLKGSVDLSHLPTKVEDVLLEGNLFDGTLDLSALPEPLDCFRASRNQFSGSLCLASLPPKLAVLTLAHNGFSGTIDLTKLPDTLRHLHLNSNNFEGYADFSVLPEALSLLDLSDNALLEGCLRDNVVVVARNTKITRMSVNECLHR